MAGTKFGDSLDPAFDVRAAEMSKTATVQQETADAVDGGNVHVSAPEPAPPGGNDDSTIEQIGGNLGDAAGDALLAAASVAPPLAAAAAVIDQGEALLDAGKDVANFAGDTVGKLGGAIGDLFGGGDDVPPGTSTFPVDPNAPVPTETPGEANARGDAIRAEQEHFDERGGGGGYVFNAGDERHGSFGDPRQEGVSDHDVHTQADPYLELDTGIAGPGAAGANAVTAPDGAFEPVSASEPHTSVGFVPTGGDGDVGAPDGAYEPVSASDPHTSVGGGFMPQPGVDVGAPDGVFEPVSASEPHTGVGFMPEPSVDSGAPDGVFEPVSESDPHTSVAGADLDAPDGAYEPVSDSELHTSVVGTEADDLPTVDGVQTEVPVGSDVQLNPQPIPPGIDLHPPSPIAPADAEVSLNPQPIPPGMGADIGEPVADAAAAAPSTTDSSIIVGGTEAPVLSDVATASAEAPVVADIEVAEVPMEDVASTIAMDDGPLFGAAEEMQAPIEEQVFADDGLDG